MKRYIGYAIIVALFVALFATTVALADLKAAYTVFTALGAVFGSAALIALAIRLIRSSPMGGQNNEKNHFCCQSCSAEPMKEQLEDEFAYKGFTCQILKELWDDRDSLIAGWGFKITNKNLEIKHKCCMLGPESVKASAILMMDVLDDGIEF